MTSHHPADSSVSARLVEKQMRNWEIARSQRLATPGDQRPPVEDFVCISRQVGAGGHDVATLLAERLGWPVFDREILHAMAQDDLPHEWLYESLDERDLSWFEEAVRAFTEPGFVRNDYFHKLTRAVLSIARQGHAVFLGRGVGFILDRTAGFRVRIVAPNAIRVRRVAERMHLTPERARATLEKLERERAAFLKTHFRADVEDPAQHDLVINAGRFTAAQAVDLVLHARSLMAGPPAHA